MFEYSSVSASSYDPSALVAKLNESTADGWDVVAIVPTGGDVSAFLKREVESAATGDGDAGATDTVTDATPTGAPAVTGDDGGIATDAPAADSTETAEAAAAASAPAAVDEPAGWAAEPEPAEVPLGSSSDEAAAGAALAGEAGGGAGDTATEAPPAVEEPPAVETPAAVESPAAEAPATPAPEPAVVTTPAGWYPDPSGRYELRYWDGSQWTEHVARQGQQFTDPPVR